MQTLARLVERDAWDEALTRAVALWRATRCAPLADLVDALAARCDASPPLAGHTAKKFQQQWLALADDPNVAAHLDVLLAGLTVKVPVAQGDIYSVSGVVARYAAWLRRLELLGELEHDPRTARALVDVLSRAPFSIGYDRANVERVYGPALELLVRIGDERSVEPLQSLPDTAHRSTLRGYYEQVIAEAVAAIGAAAAALAAADRAICDRLLARLAPPSTPSDDERELSAAVIENLDDLAAVGVYADALNERGDPRGELIALQLADERGEASAKQQKRIQTLIKAYESEWLGALTAVTHHRSYRRGFLDAAALAGSSSASDELWQSAPADARLGTVRTLVKGRGTEEHYERFIFSDAMSSLRSAEAHSRAMLDRIAAAPLGTRLEALRVRFAVSTSQLDALGALRELSVTVGASSIGKQMVTIAAREDGPRLERLAVHIRSGADDGAYTRAVNETIEKGWALAPAEGPFELVVDRACTLRRAAGAQRLDVDVEQGSLEILRMLVHGALPVARLDLRWLYAASDVSDELPEIADLLERIAPAELALERDMRAALPAKLAKQASLLP
ncbi:MAG: TIGR02996 domain-containing protein [Myxococcales bacterium]|nr:TIGR02996 domain-containing protein [Myxococcales bacterium]